MVITKGNEKFMIIDINPMEMSNIYDAFQNAFVQMNEILKMDDKTFMLYLSVDEKGIPELRKIIQDKIKFYQTFKEKILTYATKTERKINHAKRKK